MFKYRNCVLTNPFKRYGIRSLTPEHSALRNQKQQQKMPHKQNSTPKKIFKKRDFSGSNRNFLLVHITKNRVLEWNSKVSKQNPTPNKAKEKSLSHEQYVATITTDWSTAGTAQTTSRMLWKKWLSCKTRENIVELVFGRETWQPLMQSERYVAQALKDSS